MLRPVKVATPLTAATVAVPESVPAPGLVPIASVTEAVDEVTVLPCASWIVTPGCVAQALAAVPPPGWVVKASLEAAPGVTVTVALFETATPEIVAPKVTDPASTPVKLDV
jgi:hypothetical protein